MGEELNNGVKPEWVDAGQTAYGSIAGGRRRTEEVPFGDALKPRRSATIKKSERPTIMSGKVITFALGFEQEKGILGDRDVPTGPFEVSVSRDAVMIHRAECATQEQVDLLVEAMSMAAAEWSRLRSPRNGY